MSTIRRRQTLGSAFSRTNRAAPPSASRKSRKRQSMAAATAKSRHSFAGTRGSISRRSSVHGKMPHDPRNLKSHAVRLKNCKKLLTFLAERNYELQISGKDLQAPSTGTFFNICQFLMKCIDPDFKFSRDSNTRKLELINCFKVLKYPFRIKKSDLASVGAQHIWPSLLGAVTWLVELLENDETAAELAAAAKQESKQEAFYHWLSDTYICFLAGDDDRADELERELAESVETENAKLEAQIAELKGENSQLQASIEKALDAPNVIPRLEKKKADLVHDVGTFQDVIVKKKKEIVRQTKKLDAEHTTLEAKKEELPAVHATIEGLKARLEQQELKPEHVQQMNEKKAVLKQKIQALDEKRHGVQDAVWEAEMQFSKEMDVLNNMVEKYHDEATALHLLPASAKYANGVNYEVGVATAAEAASATTTSDLLRTNMKGRTTLRDALRKVKQQFTESRFTGLTTSDDLNDKLQERQEALRAVEEEVATLEGKRQKLEEAFRAEKAQLERRLGAERDEMESLEAEIDRTRETTQEEALEDAQLNEDSLKRAEAELGRLVKVLEARREAVRSKIATALDYMTTHKDEVQQKLGGLAQHVAEVRDKVKADALVA